jgi:methyltransferase (TIGR00027 family)
VDLAQQPPDEPLKAAGYDPAQKSAWLAEGVLMYLEPAVVDGVLEGVRRQSAPGSTLVFTMVDAGRAKEKGSTARATVALLQASSEPVLFTLDPETLGSWLAERGFTLRAKGDGEAMRVRYAEPLGLEGPASAGEWVVAAERA